MNAGIRVHHVGNKTCEGVSEQVWKAIAEAMDTEEGRDALTEKVGSIAAREGWRFCKCYRWEVTAAHTVVYKLLNPVGAKNIADLEERKRHEPLHATAAL